MLLQAQDFVLTQRFTLDAPVGMLLVAALLALIAAGALLESRLPARIHGWFAGRPAGVARRVATAGHRG
jgi:hypothetical protein